MYCMKCGKEIKGKQVFCDECLAIMEANPVKPGTTVQIPHRPVSHNAPPRRRVLSPEEQVPRLRKTIRWLILALVVTIAGLVLSVSLLAETYQFQQDQDNIGKNYNTVTQSDGT